MKKIILGIIIMVAIISVGINKIETHRQVDTPTEVKEKEENFKNEKIEQLDQSNSQVNNVKTYENETHKKIEYGKLSFDLWYHHIVSYIQSDNGATFKCEIDKGEIWPETHITITIRKIEKRDFLNVESIILYLKEKFPDYEEIEIYNNVIDDSGVTSLYRVTKCDLTNYVVCYSDVCYLIESDYNNLDIYLFKNLQKANYVEDIQKIKCANSFTAYVKKSISYESNKAKYDIIQGKDKTKHYIYISYDYKSKYNIIVKNEKSESLLTLSGDAPYFNDIIRISDENMDGYADILILKAAGARNNIYELYVWDDLEKSFVKVEDYELID